MLRVFPNAVDSLGRGLPANDHWAAGRSAAASRHAAIAANPSPKATDPNAAADNTACIAAANGIAAAGCAPDGASNASRGEPAGHASASIGIEALTADGDDGRPVVAGNFRRKRRAAAGNAGYLKTPGVVRGTCRSAKGGNADRRRSTGVATTTTENASSGAAA